jgi:hypothetical protein
MANKHQNRVTLRVQRVDGSWEDCGLFSKREGGAVKAETGDYYPGGMEPGEATTSQATPELVTLGARGKVERRAQMRFIRSRVGKAEAIVNDQPLDGNGNPYGQPDVYAGILSGYTPPEHDAQATGDAAEFEVEVKPHGTVG